MHEIIGLLSGFGEICHITEEEADGLTQAVLDVMAQYKIKPNPKVVAWSNLAGIAAVIYAPKVWLIMEARKLQKPQTVVRHEPARNASVSPIAGGGNATPGMMKFS